MNLSLYKLRKQIKRDKSGQGGLVAVVLAGLVGSILVSSATSWYLSMRNNMGNLEDKLEAQTIAQSEWERLSHMSLDELEAKRGELAEKYSAGLDSQYQISVNLGEKGTFNNGTCGDIGSDGYTNCFKDTTITVYRDGNRIFTTRTLPLMAGDYTRKEIDDKFASLLRLEPIDEKAKIPEGKALYAYLDGQKLPVSQGSGKQKNNQFTSDNGYYITSEGLVLQWGKIDIMSKMEGFCSPTYFPIAFPHKCINIQISTKSGYYGHYHNANGWAGVVSWNERYFIPYTDFADGIEGNIGAFWFAIGY